MIDFTKLSDEDLVRIIVERKDSRLFAVLYDRYAKLVYNKCYGFSKSKEEAEDLTHDLFIRLFVKLRMFKGRSKFSTWLYSFTYNFCVNYVQRDKAKKQEKITISTDVIKDESSYEVDDKSLFELKSDRLVKVLEAIDPKDKMILLMKYQDDMPIKEISEALCLGESAVKMRLKRAKERVINIYNNL
ncbi:MAG: sigma-70 family RNA polymerase sigma factor [Tenacibaculum sp.]|nr:sigma-70 family RNA polymerase sigma factor [Tenacibaculum sp.]